MNSTTEDCDNQFTCMIPFQQVMKDVSVDQLQLDQKHEQLEQPRQTAKRKKNKKEKEIKCTHISKRSKSKPSLVNSKGLHIESTQSLKCKVQTVAAMNFHLMVCHLPYQYG